MVVHHPPPLRLLFGERLLERDLERGLWVPRFGLRSLAGLGLRSRVRGRPRVSLECSSLLATPSVVAVVALTPGVETWTWMVCACGRLEEVELVLPSFGGLMSATAGIGGPPAAGPAEFVVRPNSASEVGLAGAQIGQMIGCHCG